MNDLRLRVRESYAERAASERRDLLLSLVLGLTVPSMAVLVALALSGGRL